MNWFRRLQSSYFQLMWENTLINLANFKETVSRQCKLCLNTLLRQINFLTVASGWNYCSSLKNQTQTLQEPQTNKWVNWNRIKRTARGQVLGRARFLDARRPVQQQRSFGGRIRKPPEVGPCGRRLLGWTASLLSPAETRYSNFTICSRHAWVF